MSMTQGLFALGSNLYAAWKGEVNRRFLTYWQQKRPYIILKWAQSSDGFMALNEPKQFWFSNEASKKLMHQWRAEEPAILVGKRTIEIDNPALTVRLVVGKNPTRITFDRNLQLKDAYAFFEANAPVIVFNAHKNEGNYVFIDFEGDVLKQVMDCLFERGIQSVMIEGGPATLNTFIQSNLWDEARVFTSPHVLQNGKPAPNLNAGFYEKNKIDSDLLQIYFREANSPTHSPLITI